MVSQEQRNIYEEQGYLVVRNLFSEAEVARIRGHFMQMNAGRAYPNAETIEPNSSDPLKRYPRIMHPHRWDELSFEWIIDARLNAGMTALLGCEPYAVQTMFYFKPAGARGQALHQDQYFLRVQPGTCMAAWMAVDDCDEENGCLQVVPGSHTWPVLCTVDADTEQSFTDITVELPADAEVVPVTMRAGDVLFFNGQLVHGSFPNTSGDRFRRALIGHYIVGEAEKVYRSYHPVLRMDGTRIELGVSEDGDTCGRWVETDGRPVLETVPKAAV
jgi:ectoine hydroxylase-related dioxygenase (phytanoyl-CoA dioxygenase family)